MNISEGMMSQTKSDFIEKAAVEIGNGFLLTLIQSPLLLNTIERDVLLEATKNFQKDVVATLHELLEGLEVGWITTKDEEKSGTL
jgi:hypothetical protein